MSIRKAHFLWFFCLLSVVTHAQVTATLRTDSSTIEIATPLNVKLSVKFPPDHHVVWPVVRDTLGPMELLLAAKIDTEQIGNETLLSQKFLVSAYDSGDYTIGPRKIYFLNQDGALDSTETEELFIRVNTLDVDTAAPFKPIKTVRDVPLTWKEWIPGIVAFHLFLLLLTAIIWYASKKKKKKAASTRKAKPLEPAHVWARKELQKLADDKLWQAGNVKSYYSRLTDIMRLYLEYRYNYYALESTTEEINIEIDKTGISSESKYILMEILRSGDLVKFAKMIPAPEANTRVLELALQMIEQTKPAELNEKRK